MNLLVDHHYNLNQNLLNNFMLGERKGETGREMSGVTEDCPFMSSESL